MSDTAPYAPVAATDQDPEAIITLACPVCDFALNMRRKHIGMEGKCISCSEPIKAVEEEPGKIIVKWKKAKPEIPAETKVAHEVPAQTKAPINLEKELSPPDPEPSSHVEPAPVVEDQSESKWGFPDRPETPATPVNEVPDIAPKSNVPANGFFDELPSEVSGPSPSNAESPGAGEQEDSLSKEKTGSTPPAFSGSDKLDATVALFASDQDDSSSVNGGWGTKVPNETHASISPFSTGSAEPDGGFAETLFREGAENKAPVETPKQSLFDDQGPGGFASNALFGSGPSSSSVKSEPTPVKKNPVNEDGHELPPLSPEEEEEMAMTMLSLQNERANRSVPGWQKFLKKLFRLFAACVILFGIGYAAYVFMPDEKAEAYKKKVLDWLEPGLVIFDYLPGKGTGGKSKGFQELDKLKGKVNDYYEEGQSQLDSTYKNGESNLDYDSDRGGSGNDENATGLDQLDKLKGDIQGFQKRSQEQLDGTYDGESGLDYDEGRPPETGDILQGVKK